MVRSSEHILKYQTELKSTLLSKLFSDYKLDLQFYINLLWDKQLPLKKNLSSKLLPSNILKHSQYKQILYKQASEIIRSNNLKKKTSKPLIKNISINIDSRLFDVQTDSKSFDEFIHLRLPYFFENKKRAMFIRLPVKYHKHSLKFKSWNRDNSIKLKENDGHYFVIYSYEKQEPKKLEVGKSLGIDQGYKKLIVISDGRFVGREFEGLYERISNKEQGSRNFRDLLIERDKKINEVVNRIDFSGVKEIVIEDLKCVKRNSKKRIYKRFMNKLQRWSYSKVTSKLERLCEENGILLIKVDPAYTSQTCSKCGSIHKESRSLELFKCIDCGYETDADLNASINILHRGVYNPSTIKSLNLSHCNK
jgi:putative transposase